MKVSSGWQFFTEKEQGADTCYVAHGYRFYVLDLISFLVTVSTATGLPW